MRKSIMLVSLTIMFVGIVNLVSAQQTVTATADVSTTIVAPLTLTKTIDLNFGNVSVSGSTAGTVVLSPAGVRSVTGGCQISTATPGTVTAAAFSVGGQSTYTYAITLPSTVTAITGSGTPINVDTYVSTPSGTGTLTTTASTINVGATLHVAAGQTVGLYTLAGGLSVSVNYN